MHCELVRILCVGAKHRHHRLILHLALHMHLLTLAAVALPRHVVVIDARHLVSVSHLLIILSSIATEQVRLLHQLLFVVVHG